MPTPRALLAALLLAIPVAALADGSAGQATIYFVRHADTAKGGGGSYIDKFTPEGDQQVEALPAKLNALVPKFDVILVSPQWRAIHTILPYLQKSGQKAQILPELTETSYSDSDSSGPRSDFKVRLSGEEEKYFTVAEGYGALLSTGVVPKAGGSDAGGKVVSFLSDLVRKQFAGKRVNVLLVGHYHTGGRLLKALQGGGVPAYSGKSPVYQPNNGAVSVLKQDCSSDKFVLVQYNDAKDFNGKPLPQGSPDFSGSVSADCGVAKAR